MLDSGGELVVYNRYDTVADLTLTAGAIIDLADQTATAATIVGGVLTMSSGSVAIESFSLSGSTAGLGVSISSNGAGGSLLSVTSGGTDSSRRTAAPAKGKGGHAGAMVQAAAAFGAAPTGLAPAHALQRAHVFSAFTLAGPERHALS